MRLFEYESKQILAAAGVPVAEKPSDIARLLKV